MRRWLLLLLVGIVGAGMTPGWGAVHEVIIRDYEFDPAELVVDEGDSVYWTHAGDVVHTVTSGETCVHDGLIDSGDLNSGDQFGWLFDEAGEFPYFCTYHCPTMEAVVTVNELTPVEITTWSRIKALFR